MGKKGNKPPQIKEEDYLKVEPDEQWLHTIAGKDFYDDSFYRIIDFFVLHSPCKVSSYSPRTLEYLGWVNPWQSSRFRNAYDEILGVEEATSFFHHEAKKHMLEMWNAIGRENFFEVDGNEFAVIIHAGEGNPRMDILHHIRNSFAHGRFAVVRDHNEYFIFMEDVTTISRLPGLYVTARMCFKKSSLISLIDFFEKKGDRAQELSSLFQK